MKFTSSLVIVAIIADTVVSNDNGHIGKCLNDIWKINNDSELDCKANEVGFDMLQATSALTCNNGEMITLSLNADIFFASERFDPGWYFALDGGNALTGRCALNSFAEADYDTYDFTNGATIQWDRDDGYGDDDWVAAGDDCGDLLIPLDTSTVLSNTPVMIETEVLCEDTNNDGTMDIATCFTWRSRGKDGVCNEKALTPGTTSKCDCERYEISNVVVEHDGDDDFADDDNSGEFDFANGEADVLAFDAFDGEMTTEEGTCLDDVNWFDFVSEITCAANRVHVKTISNDQVTSCNEGDTISITLTSTFTVKEGEAHDFAWYTAKDGGDALTGECNSNTLNEESEITLDNKDAYVDFSEDVCGDLVGTREDLLLTLKLVEKKEVQCVDENKDGFLDLSVCFVWNSPNNDDSQYYCDPLYPTLSSFWDSCDCSRHDIPEVTVITPHQDDDDNTDPVAPCGATTVFGNTVIS